jgi:hypothetical protein
MKILTLYKACAPILVVQITFPVADAHRQTDTHTSSTHAHTHKGTHTHTHTQAYTGAYTHPRMLALQWNVLELVQQDVCPKGYWRETLLVIALYVLSTAVASRPAPRRLEPWATGGL